MLVGDDPKVPVAAFDLSLDGADEVAAAEAVEPGRADDQVVVCGSRRLFAEKLGAAVGAGGRHRVVFAIGLGGGAVKDIVGGNLDQG